MHKNDAEQKIYSFAEIAFINSKVKNKKLLNAFKCCHLPQEVHQSERISRASLWNNKAHDSCLWQDTLEQVQQQ